MSKYEYIDSQKALPANLNSVVRMCRWLTVSKSGFYHLCRCRNNLDLLFFHTEQLRYVVVELKTGKFKPEHSGQLGFYVALVDERLRRPQHAHTVGILLCSDKNDSVVRYALAGSQAPIAVSSYDLLPAAEKAALPSEDELTRAVKGSRDG